MKDLSSEKSAGFALTGWLGGLGLAYSGAVVFTVIILLAQHLILPIKNPGRLSPAFFTLNGLVSVGLGVATWISLAS